MTSNGLTILIAIVSSGGLWAFLQFVVGRHADAARLKTDRAALLADAQAVAQKTALDSADRALNQVTRRLDVCLREVHQLRGAAEALIDAFETYVAEDSLDDRLAVRAAMRALRQVLYADELRVAGR